MGLADKFEKVNIKSTDLISAEDKRFCDKWLEKSNEVLDQLKTCWDINKPLFDNEGLGHKIDGVNKDYVTTKTWDYDSPEGLNRFKYSYAESTLEIQQEVRGLVRTLYKKLITYFEKKYNLELDRYGSLFDSELREVKGEDLFKKITYERVIDYLREKTGGADLTELGISNFKNDFRSNFQKRGVKDFELKGQRITVNSYTSLGYKIKYNDWRFKALAEALNFFDSGNIDARRTHDTVMFDMMDTDADPYAEIKLENLAKVESVKFYKNQRLDIKFSDAQTCREFYLFYKLNELE